MTIPTLGQDKVIEVPAGTQHGHRMTLTGEGIARLRGVGKAIFMLSSVKVPKNFLKNRGSFWKNSSV